MSITEEQRIEFIISKIDIHLDEFKDLPIKEAVECVFQKHLNEDEKKNFRAYFYKLYKGYSKYRHLNLMIDYHKTVERMQQKDSSINTPNTKDESLEVFSPVSVGEVNDIDAVNHVELIKLKTFGTKAVILVFIVGIGIYAGLLALLSGDYIEIVIKLTSMFT